MASKKKSAARSDNSMKIMVVAALLVAFIGGYLVARAKYKPQILELTKMVADKDMSMQKVIANANKVVMKDGKMLIVENGIVREMDVDAMMSNGTKVMQDGSVIKSGGQEMKMQNGDAMDMDGNMMTNGAGDVEAPSF